LDYRGSQKEEAIGKFPSGSWARIDPSKQANENPSALGYYGIGGYEESNPQRLKNNHVKI